jgi:hypothetical protein
VVKMPDVIQTIVTKRGERIITPILWDLKTGEAKSTKKNTILHMPVSC